MVTPTRPAGGTPRDDDFDADRAAGDVQICRMCNAANSLEQNFCGSCGFNLTGVVPELMLRDPLIGVVVADRYRIIAKIGMGGMGVVYKAEHVRIGKLLAMKLLHGDLSRDTTMIRRFNREARAVSRLTSRHTAQVFDYGQSEGLFYIIMEFLRGRDLGDVLSEFGSLSPRRTSRILNHCALALHEAHEKYIVHRDLKPENLFVCRDRHEEIVKVLDFGLAKLRDRPESLINTQRGSLLGTPYYMAPEQIDGDDVNHLCDVYALGAVTYKILTGHPPYPGDNPFKVINKHLQSPIPRISTLYPHYRPLNAFFERALAKRPEDRYTSVLELARAFETACQDIEGFDRNTLTGVEPVSAQTTSVHPDDELPTETIPFKTTPPDIEPPTPATPAAEPELIPDYDPTEEELLSTRADFGSFERRLKIRRAAFVVFSLAVLAGAAFAVYWGVILGNFFDESMESEPNNSPREANPLRPERPLTASLGEHDNDRPDRDVFRLEDVSPGEMIRISVTPIPDLDIVLELVDESGVILLRQNAEGPGYGETITNFPRRTENSMLFVSVREFWKQGTPRQTRPDILYKIRLSTRPSVPGEELEPNDSRDKASPTLETGVSLGNISSPEDIDTFAITNFDEDTFTLRARLSGLEQTDLSLTLIDHTDLEIAHVDDQGLGVGEAIEAPIDASAITLPLYLVVRSTRGFSSEQQYQLSYERLPQ